MKKKKITRFAICRRGYDIDAVESYIALEQAKADEVQLQQRDRINRLKEECAELKDKIAVYEGRENQIKLALVTATENANRLSEDVKSRYRAELERLRLFRAKWTGAYEQMKERYHFDKDALNVESVAVSVEIELKKFLMQDFSLNKCVSEDEMEAHFRSEVERLTEQQLLRQDETAIKGDAEAEELRLKLKEIEKKKRGKNAGDSVAFSIEEALNPKQTIEQTCKALELA